MTDRKHRIECECSHPNHFIEINYMELPESKNFPGSADIDVYFCAHRVGGFWKRLVRGCQYVFGSQGLVTADFVISRDMARGTARFLNDIALAGDQFEGKAPKPPAPRR